MLLPGFDLNGEVGEYTSPCNPYQNAQPILAAATKCSDRRLLTGGHVLTIAAGAVAIHRRGFDRGLHEHVPWCVTYCADMSPLVPLALTVSPGAATRVAALLLAPPAPRAAFVFAHGAGAGMTHPFMGAVAEHLAERGIATLRFQFPYIERGFRRPDAPAVAQAAVRAAVAEAAHRLPGVPLLAGGKSFGGRMTSQAQAGAALPGVKGLVFLGFPLHPAGRPSIDRAQHLANVRIPMLFLQGTRDALAEPDLIARVAESLEHRATLVAIPDADHSFHVPARTGRTDAQILADMCDSIAAWTTTLCSSNNTDP